VTVVCPCSETASVLQCVAEQLVLPLKVWSGLVRGESKITDGQITTQAELVPRVTAYRSVFHWIVGGFCTKNCTEEN